MELTLLEDALIKNKQDIENAVLTSRHRSNTFQNPNDAKIALIRSSQLIQRIHQWTKIVLFNEFKKRGIHNIVYPPIDHSSPEITISGLLKSKKQDVVLFNSNYPPSTNVINGDIALDSINGISKVSISKSVVVGVRSQLSSIDKNFDTLMERAFAETLNLRLLHPELVMGEVYMILAKEYDNVAMKEGRIEFKDKYTKVAKFINLFNSISHRNNSSDIKQYYKYERSVLLIVDNSCSPIRLFKTLDELKEVGAVPNNFEGDYSKLSPVNFAKDLVDSYMLRHHIY